MKTTKMLVYGGVFFLVTGPCLADAGTLLNASSSRQNAAAQDLGTQNLGTQKLTIDLTGADLHSVVSSLMRQVPGLNLMLKDGDLAYKPVYLRLTDAPIESVLQDVALSSGAELTRNDDGSFFLHPPTPVPAPVTPALPVPVAQVLPPVVAAPAMPAPATSGFEWHKLILRHAIPSEILTMLGWAGSGLAANPFDRVRLSPSNSNTITSSSGASSGSTVTPAVAVPMASGAGSLTTGQANRSAELLGPDQAQQFPGQQYGGGYGGQNFSGGNFPGGNQPPFAPSGRGGPNGGSNLPEGVSKIYALEADNSLLLLATPDGFTQVSQLVKMLDILPRQVQIKVEFVTASVNDVDAFGIDVSYAPFFSTNQGDSANLASTPQTSITVGRGRGVVQLYDSLVRGKGQIVQAPIVTTTNNVPAQINVAQQVPYTTSSTVLNGSGTGATNTTTQFLTINTGLAVSPRINSDDSITLSLAPQISDISGAALDNGAPPTVTETLTTLRTVRNGETMVIGGLIRKSETHSQSRVPVLSNLPLIGGLFRTHDNAINNSELLIFVTPTIIGDNTDDPPPIGPSVGRR